MPTVDAWADLGPAWWQVGPTWAGIFQPEPWTPEPSILINGINYTGDTIGTVTIRRGRDSVYVEPSASYADVTLRSFDTAPPIQVGDRLTINLNTLTVDNEPLFSGRISDIAVSVTPGTVNVSEFRYTAVGPLAGASRRQVLADGRPEELDGERALAAILGAIAPTWEGQPVDLEWSEVAGSYADFAGAVDLDTFDDGVFTVAALAPQDGGVSGLQAAQEAAFSGKGVLYEDRRGRVAYADAARRAITFSAGDFFRIPADVLDVSGLNASSALSEVANRVLVDWDNGVVQADIVESQIRLGIFVRRIRTILANQTDAQRRADEEAEEQSLPVFKADQFRLLLNNLSGPLLQALIRVEPNDGVDFFGLPTTVGFTRLLGFVEGVEWRIDPFRVELGLFVSDERLSVGGVWWGRVSDTLEWGDVDAALGWQDVGRTL